MRNQDEIEAALAKLMRHAVLHEFYARRDSTNSEEAARTHAIASGIAWAAGRPVPLVGTLLDSLDDEWAALPGDVASWVHGECVRRALRSRALAG